MNLEAARILVIDDDELTLTILRKMLESDGYEVDVCSSGSEALAKLLHSSYDAMLCDMWMAGMTGKDFYMQLKQGFPEYTRRVVFITGDIASEATWEFIDERHLPYVIKPISRPLLRRKVREIVGDRPEPQPEVVGRSSWDGINRRRHRRVAINAAARVRRKKWEVAGPDTANVVNASRGGIFFVSDREYRVGMEVLVAYPYTGYDDVEQDGYVVRVDEKPDGKRGVAIAIGEEAVAAQAAFAGSEGDVRRHHILSAPERAAGALAAAETGSFAKASQEDEDGRRKAEELEELIRAHDQVVDERDRMAAKEAALKKEMAELEAAKAAASQKAATLEKDVEARKEEVAEQRHRATHDALTGLFNRGAILDMLRDQIVRAEREGKAVGVLLGDLDHFKSVNDTYGHLAGDAVLREAATRISAAVRSYDLVGRYGGEEFLILLTSCEDDTDMVKQAERVRSQVCAEAVLTTEAKIDITLSLGAASSSDYQEVEDILRAADAALYRAKRAGRNRVELACTTEPTSA